MQFGLQLFGFSKDFNKDPEGFFARISEGGFKLVEPCLTFTDENKEDWMWSPEDVDNYLPVLMKYGLSMISAHVFVADWEKDLPKMCEIAAKTGITQMR